MFGQVGQPSVLTSAVLAMLPTETMQREGLLLKRSQGLPEPGIVLRDWLGLTQR